jgi:membrane fusion protein (multidrug efflux system)
MPVDVVTVQQSDVPVSNEWVGTLDGFVNAQIQPQVSGYLIKQNYREGSVVQKGQALFEIDPRPFQAALQQAEGQVGQAQGAVGQAQAQFQLAQINVNRDTPLAAEHAIAQSQLDNEKQQAAQAEASVASARASVAAAQAAVANAKLNLGFTEVRSLITGVAGQATTQVGNLVGPQSVLTSVSQLDPIKVYFSISDSEYLGLIKRTTQSNADLLRASSNLPLTLTLANGSVFPHTGRIIFVDRQMNQQTGAIRIAASFPNPGNVLRPGQFGRVRAQTTVLNNAILVPQSAVQELQGIEQVRPPTRRAGHRQQSAEAPRRRTRRSASNTSLALLQHHPSSGEVTRDALELLHPAAHRRHRHRHPHRRHRHRVDVEPAHLAIPRHRSARDPGPGHLPRRRR